MKKYFIEGGLGSGFSGIMNSGNSYWSPLTKAIGDKLAGWWFVTDSETNEVPNKVPGGSPAIIQGDAFKGNGATKATRGANDYFIVPGYEDFSLTWKVIISSISTTYSVIFSYYNSVILSRIQFNNSAFYIYDDAGNEVHWNISAISDGYHTMELRGSAGNIELLVDNIIIGAALDATNLGVCSIGDALKDEAGNGCPSWLTIFDIKLRTKRQYFVNVGDKTSSPYDNHKTMDAYAVATKPDHIIGSGDFSNTDQDPDSNTLADMLSVYVSAGYVGTKFWATLGNHSIDETTGAEKFNTFFGYSKSYYTKVIGSVELFIFDVNLKADESGYHTTVETEARSQASFEGSIQGIWLLNALAASTARWKIVIFHQCTYSSASTLLAPGMRWDWYALGVDMLINGHGHLFERLAVPTGSGTIVQIMNGHGGANESSWSSISPYSVFRAGSTLYNNMGMSFYEIHTGKNFMYMRLRGFNVSTYILEYTLDPFLMTKTPIADISSYRDQFHFLFENLDTGNYLLYDTIKRFDLYLYTLATENIVKQDYYSWNYLKSGNPIFKLNATSGYSFTSNPINGLTEWTIAFRFNNYEGAEKIFIGTANLDYDSICTRSGYFSFGKSGTPYIWSAGGGVPSHVLASYYTRTYTTWIIYSDGTNIHLIMNGIYRGYKTPPDTTFALNYLSYQNVVAIWDLRIWNSNIGQTEALKFHGDTMAVIPDHKWHLRNLIDGIVDSVGNINLSIVGTPTQLLTTSIDGIIDVNGQVLLYPQDGHKFIPNTKIKLPEDAVVIAAATNISGNDWFDAGDNANAISVEAIVDEDKEQYIDATDRDNLILVKNGETITDEEDTLIKSITHG